MDESSLTDSELLESQSELIATMSIGNITWDYSHVLYLGIDEWNNIQDEESPKMSAYIFCLFYNGVET